MCGIVGIVKLRGTLTKEDKEFFTHLLTKCEARGKNATGICADGNIYKLPLAASKFVKLKDYKRILKNTKTYLLGHCRLPTKGDEKKNYQRDS